MSICMKFPKFMRRSYVVCEWAIDFQIFSTTLLMLSNGAYSHQLDLVYALMNWKKMVAKFVKEE